MMITRTLLASLLCIGFARAAAPPEHMQAITIDHYGGVEVLEEHTVAVPALAPDEVLIAVHTAGVGPWDADLRAGGIPDDKAKFPMVLGSDGSGTVVAVGADVRTLHVGQAVYSYSWANPKGGFYAQYVAVAAKRVAPIPKNLNLTEAGAVATTGLTAVQGIDDALHIRKGELLIIHGAQGGVGTLALQLAKLRGARVLATASGADGLALVRKLGADVAVDGRTEDVTAAARRFAPNGADALLALAAGPALDQLRATLRDGALLAYPSGVKAEPKTDQRVKVLRYDAIPGVAEFARLNQALESIHVEVPIAAEFPLSAVREAHQRIATGHLLGKVILNVQALAEPQRSTINGPRSAERAPLPFSDAVRVGDTLYLSGTVGLDPRTDRAAADPKLEATTVMDRVRSTVESAGFSMDDVVAMQVYCTDLALYDTFNSVYRGYFTHDFPARAFIGVKELLRGAHFEVMGIAVRPHSK